MTFRAAVFFAPVRRAAQTSPNLTLFAPVVSAQSATSLICVSESSDMRTAFLPHVTANERPWLSTPPVLFSSLTSRRFFLRDKRDQTCPNCGAWPCECEPYGIARYLNVISVFMQAAFSFFARRMALRTVPNLS